MGETEARHRRPPLVLIINDQEWSTRSLESILAPSGYAVLRAYTGSKGLERAQSARPDVVVVGVALPDMDGFELCRQLREDPRITPSTAVIITTTTRPTRPERLAALRAGAWDFVGQPIDAEELLLRFDCFVRAKHDADAARDGGMLDTATGLYSLNGLSRRARELGSQAYRQNAPLACVVFRAEGPEHEPPLDAVVHEFAERLRTSGRASDAIGRIGGAEFAVFATSSGRAGAEALIQRLLDPDSEQAGLGRISVGCYAVENFREANLHPQDMLARAAAAMPRPATVDTSLVN